MKKLKSGKPFVEADVRTVRMIVPFLDDEVPDTFPFIEREGEFWGRWTIDIDVKTGVIKNWTPGCKGRVFIKPRDEGSYYLLDENDAELLSIVHRYVPNKLIPPTDSVGDYVDLFIDGDGRITNWYENPCFSEFLDEKW